MGIFFRDTKVLAICAHFLLLLTSCGGGGSDADGQAAAILASATRLFFVGDYDDPMATSGSSTGLFSVEPDGSGLTQLDLGVDPALSGLVVRFSVSPSRQRVAYIASYGSGIGVYTNDSEGSLSALVRQGQTNYLVPLLWGPNSSRVAFSQPGENNYYALMVGRPDGSDLVEIGAPRIPYSRVYEAYWPDNGANLVYVADESDTSRRDIYAASPNGIGRIQVNKADGSPIPVHRNMPVSVSDDGRFVSFVEQVNRYMPTSLYIASVVSGNSQQVNFPADAMDAVINTGSWSPDGQYLAVVGYEILHSSTYANPTLFIVSNDGLNIVSVDVDLTGFGYADRIALSWSPNSNFLLVYGHDGPNDNQVELYLVSPDGTKHWVAGQDDVFQRIHLLSPRWGANSSAFSFEATRSLTDDEDVFVYDIVGQSALNASISVTGASNSFGLSAAESRLSPSGEHVAFIVWDRDFAIHRLFVSSSDGLTSSAISAEIDVCANLGEYQWSADSSRIFFLGRESGSNKVSLFVNETSGGTPWKVSGGIDVRDADYSEFISPGCG